jgi:hypothetical protein
MTVEELIIALEELAGECEAGMEAKVEVHFQPSYPLKATINSLNTNNNNNTIRIALNPAKDYGDSEAWGYGGE